MKTRNDVPGLHRPLRRRSPRALTSLAGRLDAAAAAGGFEALEGRILLAGDHPSFMRPLLPNDSGTLIEAPQLADNGEAVIAGTIGTIGDDDLFRFVMPGDVGDTDFVAVLADTTATGSNVDTRIEVYDQMGRVLVGPGVMGRGGFDNGLLSIGLAQDGWGGFVARAGETYFVRVVGEGFSSGEYQLRVNTATEELQLDLRPTVPDPVTGEEVPNPNFGLGQINGVLGPVDDLEGVFQQDEIVYRVDLDPGMIAEEFLALMRTMASANAKIALDPDTGLPIDRVDTHLEVYDAEGNLIVSDIEAGRLTNAFATWRSNPGDMVFIRVRSDELVPPSMDPQIDQTAGEFTLVVQAARREIEVDTVMRLGPADVRGILADGTDTNMWSFVAQGTGVSFINVVGLPVGFTPPLPDPAITLYSESGEVLAFADDSIGRNASLEIRLVGGERYFLLVEGFDDDFGGGYGVFIEAHHTFDDSQAIDDHVDTPPDTLTPAERRRRFEEATPIRFNFENPFLYTDADGNPIRDHGWVMQGLGKGRVHEADDTDLFQFTAPVDMLSDYAGNNDDAGTSLFVGGRFTVADPTHPVPVDSANLAIWDANDWWHVGPTGSEEFPLGFVDNPDTAQTPGPETYAMFSVEAGAIGNSDPFLMVGGDFDLIIGYDLFGNPIILKNLAVWFFSPNAGRYVWGTIPAISDPDGPVRAFTIWDPGQFSIQDGDTSVQFDDPAGAMLVIGGDFRTLGALPATVNRIAGFSFNEGLLAFPNDDNTVGIPNGSVNALAVYDPEDPGEGRAQQDDPPLSEVPDPYDPPATLFIGGSFTHDVNPTPLDFGVTTVSATGLITHTGAAFGPAAFGVPLPNSSGVSGGAATVHSLQVFDADDPDGPGAAEDPPPLLYVGGSFTTAGGVAAANIARFGLVDPSQDPEEPEYAPHLLWEGQNVGLSASGPVFAMAVYDIPEAPGQPPFPLQLVVGGAFDTFGGFPDLHNLAGWTGFGVTSFGLGFNAPVHSLAVFQDQQEVNIQPIPGVDESRDVLFAGGAFDAVLIPDGPDDGDEPDELPTNGVAQFDLRLNEPLGQLFYGWTPLSSESGVANAARAFRLDGDAAPRSTVPARLPGGVANDDGSPGATVFAMAAFDDHNPQVDNSELSWDRNDRPGSRLSITLSPDTGWFLDAYVRIYDSNFTLIYENDRIVPLPQTDPAGSIDPAIAGIDQGRPQEWNGIEVWAGETYYIEVSAVDRNGDGQGGDSTGRYTLSVITEAPPPSDITTGVTPGAISSFDEAPDQGRFDVAQFSQFGLDGAGDDSNTKDARDDFNLFTSSDQTFDSRIFDRTPQNRDIYHRSDLGNIHSLFDSDLFAFRATGIGTNFVEVRLATANIFDTFNEGTDDPLTNVFTDEINQKEKILSSFFDGSIRIFNNDFVEIGFNDFNPAVGGEFDPGFTGTNADRTFFHRDPRVVFEVTGGEIYYILIESGQLRNVVTDDMGEADTSLVDWRMASGAYELMVNAVPDLNVDGMDDHQNTFSDDLFEFVAQRSTPIPLDIDPDSPDNGRGFASGIIDHNTGNPDDSDIFQFIGAHTGIMRVTISAAPGSPLAPAVLISDSNRDTIAAAAGAAGGSASAVFLAQRGDRFFISISGTGDSEGAYTIRIEAVDSEFNPITGVITDDHADVGSWLTATEVDIIRFGGRGTADGVIEETADTDVFRFTATSYEIATVTVTSLSTQLSPAVIIYEIGADPAMNPIFLQIGQDRDGGSEMANTTFSTTPGRDYYVVVLASEPEVGFGDYQVLVDLASTDDHPNLIEFPVATDIPIDYNAGTGFGQGSATGEIEVETDTDLFRFTSPQTGEAVITVTTPDSGLALRLRLIDADTGETLILSDGSPAVVDGQNGQLTFTLTDDLFIEGRAFFLLIEPGEIGTGQPELIGTYSIAITTAPADDHADVDEIADATPLILDPNLGTVTAHGLIFPLTDTDLFTFTTLASGRVRISADTPGSTLAPSIRVLAADGFTVITSTEGNGTSAFVEFTATDANQRYYIVVLPTAGSDNETGTGFYTLAVQGNTGLDDHANANEWGDATVVSLDTRKADGQATGVIDFDGDTDLFVFTALDNGPARVQIVTSSGSTLNASVRVFNSLMGQVAFNAQGLPGSTANLQFNAVAGEQYFVLVEPETATQGAYTLRLDTDPVTHFLYHPEGFSSNAISEFIPLVNPNEFEVTYTIIARYEVGQRDQVIATGTIAAHSRGGVTVNDRFNEAARLVRPDTPYALEIQSSGPLGATLSHYDFGITTGENFTDTLSTTWTFAEAHRDADVFRDFLVFYNPNDVATIVHVKQVYESGAVNEFDITVDAFRRGGVNFTTNDQIDLDGRFGLVVTANVPIVAALTSFDIAENRGYGLLGQAGQGATEGVIPQLDADDDVESGLSIFNSTSTPAEVTIRAMYDRVDLPDIVQTVAVAANSTIRLTAEDLGLTSGQTAAITYTSEVPVTVNAFEFQNGDGDATAAAVAAGTSFLFGDAFVNPAFAGITYIENLAVFNPTEVVTTITLTFLFTDGTTATSSVNVEANDFAHISIDQQPAILNRVAPTAFSLQVTSTVPVLTSFVHYDLFLNGGWSAIGAPIGFTNPVATI